MEGKEFVEDPAGAYNSDIIYPTESYEIIKCCIEVHNELGHGFNEIVYKDALCIEFANHGISFEREKDLTIEYKGVRLARTYYCDFLIENKIVIEVKAQSTVADANVKQLLNYLAAGGFRLGILVNFGESSLKYKRVVR